MNFFNNLGNAEILIIIFVLLLIFGKKKIMEWARGLGESGRELKKVKKEFEGTLHADDQSQNKNKSLKKEGR